MTVTYTFDVFCSLDGYGSYSSSGDWGKQGPEFLDGRLALYGEEQRMVLGANTFRQFVQVLGPSTEESEASDPVNPGCGTCRQRWCRPHGKDIDDMAEGLRNGSIDPADVPPIRLVYHEGELFTLDHRRLIAFQDAGVDIPYRMATPHEIETIWPTRFSTTTGGRSIQLAWLSLDGRP